MTLIRKSLILLLLLATVLVSSATLHATSGKRSLGGGPSTGPSGGVGLTAQRMQP